jgi:hypothetical protein
LEIVLDIVVQVIREMRSNNVSMEDLAGIALEVSIMNIVQRPHRLIFAINAYNTVHNVVLLNKL